MHSVLASTDALNEALRRFTPPPSVRPGAAAAAAADKHSDPAPPVTLPIAPGSSQAVPRGSRDPQHPLVNRDLDTGSPVRPAGYRLTDDTYADLLHRLALHPDQPVPPGIKADILAYYADPALPFATKSRPEAWAAVQQDLVTLVRVPTSTNPDPFPTYDPSEATQP